MQGWIANVLAMADVRPRERVLVMADLPLREQGNDLASAVRSAGAEADVVIWQGERPMRAAPPGLMATARNVDVLLGVVSEVRPEEAGPRFALVTAVAGHGGRAVLIVGDDDALQAADLCLPAPELRTQADDLLSVLRGTRDMHLRTPAGTDLRLDVHARHWRTDVPPLGAGGFGSYPYGAVFCSPHRHGASGTLVVDVTIPGLAAGMLAEPVRLRFAAGRVVAIEGDEVASRLQQLVEGAGAGADTVAEVAIGLNPSCAPSGRPFLDEKAAGTASVALGRNTGAHGGHNEAGIHVRCVFAAGEVRADGRLVTLPV